MANTWSFFPTAAVIIVAALRRCRAYDPEDTTTITTIQYSNALETLNFLVSAWQAHGLQMWCRKTGTGTLVASQGIYTIGSGGNFNLNRPLTVLKAWLNETSTGIDTPLDPLGQNEYLSLSQKTITGATVSWYYDPTYDGSTNKGATSTGSLYLWPYPDSTTASTKTVKFFYQRPLEDFDATSDVLDFPQEWSNALRLNLALAIAPEYGLQAQDYDRLKIEAKEAFDLACSWDSDMESITISPEPATTR